MNGKSIIYFFLNEKKVAVKYSGDILFSNTVQSVF